MFKLIVNHTNVFIAFSSSKQSYVSLSADTGFVVHVVNAKAFSHTTKQKKWKLRI
jgi:hypothetical protein